MRRFRTRRTDGQVAPYVGWRESCRVLDDAYRAWLAERGCRAATAFARYTAALDAEERAASAYAAFVRVGGASIPTGRVTGEY